MQFRVVAPNPVWALSSAFSEWSDAVHRLGAPAWEMVRAEVLTRAEFEQDCQPNGLGNGVDQSW